MHIASGVPPNTERRHIYLDMDGVLCDLHKAVLSFHDRMDLFDLHDHDLEASLGMTTDEIWQPIMNAGWEWWLDLEPLPWTFELWAWAHEVAGEVYVLTRPLLLDYADARDIGHSVRGKMAWLRHHFGRKLREVIFTSQKHTVSQPGVVLIDDDKRYAATFHKFGGRQIIFPRHYNELHDAAHDPMDYVRTQFQLLRD